MTELLTHSRIEAFQRCRRYHYNAYVLGVRPPPSEALRFGSAIHRAIEMFHGGSGADEAAAWLLENYGTLIDSADTSDTAWFLNIELEKALRLFRGWAERWQSMPMTILAVERQFELPIINPETNRSTPTFRFAGRMDAIVSLEDGRVALYELKTVSDDISAGSDYRRQLQLDSQITRYVRAAHRSAYNVSTVLYDLIRKPEISPRQIPMLDADGLKVVLDADGRRVMLSSGKPRQAGDASCGWTLQTTTESAEQYGERLAADLLTRPEFYFARVEVPRLEHELAEADAELWDMQRDISEAIRTGRHYKNTRSCRMPGRCPYFDCCVNGVDLSAALPEGFVRVANIHPELENQHGSTSSGRSAEGSAAPPPQPDGASSPAVHLTARS